MVPYSLCIAVLFCTLAWADECAWDRDVDFSENPPIIFDESFEIVRPVLEDNYRMVRVTAGSKLILDCPGTNITSLAVTTVEATCDGGRNLWIDDKTWEMKDLGCTAEAAATIRRNTGSCGSEDIGVIHIIGFEILGPESFYELIRVCFDPTSETTLYSQNVIKGRNIAAKDVDPNRPDFKTSSGFFTVSMSSVYSQNSQLNLMTELLGDSYLEYATRDLAESHGDLTIFSGGWGVLQLNDINNNIVEIYLGLSEDQKVVPAPAVTWKVIHDEARQQAVAVVGVNNPHLTTAPTRLCDDLCDRLTWINFDISDLVHGFTYCCTVDDLRQAVPHVPDLGDVELLTE
ncbi:uncharacterized protein [Cherax quadricarinatus]|uniref:uncharacterized protein isoform X2 n=1 Tax=Cherax quadricarinatus TaxID=27406 RepID=UPI00387E8AAF